MNGLVLSNDIQVLSPKRVIMDGQVVESLTLIVNGHRIKVNCFDGNEENVIVWIDNNSVPGVMSLDEVNGYISYYRSNP